MPTAGEFTLASTPATFTFANDLTEQTVVTLTNARNIIFKGIWLDLNALTQDATIRGTYMIDGSVARPFDEVQFLAAGNIEGVFIHGELPRDADITITLQSNAPEGAQRLVPYELWYEDMGAVPS